MSLMPSSRIAVLTLSVSLASLATCRSAGQAAESGSVQFGAPPLPAAAEAPPADSAVQPSAPSKAVAGAPWLPNRTKPQASATPDSADPGEPNLSALRFYANQNDLARVAAEIRLLRAKFPGWEPPADLFSAKPSGESEQPLWDLFGKHDSDALQAAITERQQRTPGWQPSADLTTKIASAQAYDAMIQASDRRDYGTVIDIAAANRGLMTCGNIDAVWRTAEALALTDDEPHAVEAYRFVLTNCPAAPERLATVQKASQMIKSTEAVDALVRLGKRLPNGTNEFADVLLDRVRQRVGGAAANKSEAQPSENDLNQLAVQARSSTGRNDAELLGWYYLSRKNFAEAETWFQKAMQPTPTAKAAEGLVLAMRDGGKMAEALKLAAQYAGLGPLNRKVMMEVMVSQLADTKAPLSTDQLAALGDAIDAEKSADAAQSFGWSRYAAGDIQGARGWFKKSLDWQPNEAAAVGLMVAARRLKNSADYATVVTTYKQTFPRVAELDGLMKGSGGRGDPRRIADRKIRHFAARGMRVAKGDGWDQSATAIVQTFESGRVDSALAMMDARRSTHTEPAGLSVVRGWALYKKGDWEGARQVFNEVGHRGLPSEASKGLTQIELGYTNPRYR